MRIFSYWAGGYSNRKDISANEQLPIETYVEALPIDSRGMFGLPQRENDSA